MFKSDEEPFLVKEIESYVREARVPTCKITEPKKTPCKKCGGFDFKQRYHAIVDSEGYLDENREFTATNTDIDEITYMHEFECTSCGTAVEDPDEANEED